MEKFTIPQRKAYVAMLEAAKSKLEYRSRLDYSRREAERERLISECDADGLAARLQEITKAVDSEIEQLDREFRLAERDGVEEITLAIADIWACGTADEAKTIVQRFVHEQYQSLP